MVYEITEVIKRLIDWGKIKAKPFFCDNKIREKEN